MLTAAGVAAAIGAAQVGLGYGLEIISWRPGTEGLSSEAWLASLAWATWIAATSTIIGAVAADRISLTARPGPVPAPPRIPAPRAPEPDGGMDGRGGMESDGGMENDGGMAGEGTETDQAAGASRPAPPPASDPAEGGGLWRVVLAAAAAVGATATVALTAIPARMADPPDATSPLTVAAGYAVLGVVVGLALAVGALRSRAVAANVLASAAWLWLLAVVAVVDGVLAGRDWERVPLAFWEFTADPDRLWGVSADSQSWFGNIFVPDFALAAGAALIIGALAALPAARRGDHPAGVVVSGAAGPLLVAAAYLLSQPRLAGAETVDVSRHLIVPYLVLAGILGSLVITMVRPRSGSRPAAPAGQEGEFAGDRVSGPATSET